MAKFAGKVAFALPVEKEPGIFVEEITEKSYTGDVIRQTSRWNKGEGVNENINVDNRISVIADAFFKENLGYIRYVTLNGQRWKINSAEISYPRIILNVGGLYNGPTA